MQNFEVNVRLPASSNVNHVKHLYHKNHVSERPAPIQVNLRNIGRENQKRCKLGSQNK